MSLRFFKHGLFIMMMVLSFSSYAVETNIELEKVTVNLKDIASIERGAKTFATLCMSCHTLIYLRYDKLAKKNGILYEKMPVKVQWPVGAAPPDLSLETSARGADWVYTYLHSFYADPSRPTGFNNLLIPNAMMPGILSPMQGRQILVTDLKESEKLSHHFQWYDLLSLQSKGTMDSTQFDAMVTDIVNFLSYAAEPYYEEQVRLGWKVILFLIIFFVMVYRLKKLYWKDIKS